MKINASRTGLALALAAVVAIAGPAARAQVILVPNDTDLQTAIDTVPDGGVIEIATGTYAAPPGGFDIDDVGRAFTIRAALGATVVLDGGGVTEVVRYRNSVPGNGGPIVFERLEIANGRSTTDAIGSGITVSQAEATFVGCTFRNNDGDAPSTGSGATHLTSATAFFVDCVWRDNRGTNEGAGMALQNSTAWVHRGTFLRNRTNFPSHRTTAAGGGIHVGNSTLRVTNSRFEANEAGYVGGGLYAIGTFTDPVSVPRSEVAVANSTFADNLSRRDPSVTFSPPTEGGGLHAEDQATVRVYNSRFLENHADNGGGVNLYRAIVEVEDSVFRGNRALATGSSVGFGGAISAISNDAADATTNFGAINRRSSMITVRDSLIQGRFGATTVVAQSGGGLFVTGDNNRVYGGGGISPAGTVAQNRAQAIVDGTVFYDLDVEGTGVSGKAGGINANLTDLDVTTSLLAASEAVETGATGFGGALLGINQSDVLITDTTVADNAADRWGGGMFLQGSEASVVSSQLFENELSPGVAETASQSTGAAIFTTIDDFRDLDMTGSMTGSVLAGNIGLPIFDDDRNNGPINDFRWNDNELFSTTFGASVYKDSLTSVQDTPGLNALVVSRANGTSTDKSTVANVFLGSAPALGALIAVPREVIPATAVGDAETETEVFLGYAWTGGSATLDGSPVSGNSGLLEGAGTGIHTLSVAGTPFQATVTAADAPAVTFDATPSAIAPGGTSTLEWGLAGGTFLDIAMDQGVAIPSASSGSVQVAPSTTTTYRLFLLTREGGAVSQVTVAVDDPDLIFADGFESGNTSSWSDTVL